MDVGVQLSLLSSKKTSYFFCFNHQNNYMFATTKSVFISLHSQPGLEI